MFQAALRNGCRYCGPTSLSAVTGIGTKEIAQTVRHYYPAIKRVRGLHTVGLTKILDHFGVQYKTKPCKGSLRTWVEDYRRANTPYIVHVSNHYLVVYNNQVVCTQFGGEIGPLTKSKYLRCRVHRYWMIESDPKKGVEIPAAKVEKRLSVRSSFRRKVTNICDKYDIAFEDWDYLDSKGEMSIWMYLPDEMIEKCFGGADPWHEEHYFDSYEECWNRLQEVLKVVEPSSKKKCRA